MLPNIYISLHGTKGNNIKSRIAIQPTGKSTVPAIKPMPVLMRTGSSQLSKQANPCIHSYKMYTGIGIHFIGMNREISLLGQ